MTVRDDWFFTYSGQMVYASEPDPSKILIEDIAHALSLQCRYNGHVTELYSVAQHSVIVSRNVPQRLAKAALLHDAAEAYLGDVIRPVKRQLKDFRDLELVWMDAIETAFNVSPLDHPLIKEADGRALMTERRDLCPAWSREREWVEDELGLQAFDKKILPLAPEQAKRLFLARWGEVS